MQVTETVNEGLKRAYTIVIPADDIEQKLSARLTEIAKTAQMPGFRPGKVPVSVLRKKYGSSVLGEVLERAVNDSSQQALAEKGLRPAMQPQIEITSFEDGGDLEYTIGVELLPEIKPVDFSKIKLERLIPKTDDAAMENTLADIAAAQGIRLADLGTGKLTERGGGCGCGLVMVANNLAVRKNGHAEAAQHPESKLNAQDQCDPFMALSNDRHHDRDPRRRLKLKKSSHIPRTESTRPRPAEIRRRVLFTSARSS